MPKSIDTNRVSLAGEFAVLSQLALRGIDANMTLGRTKGVDILASDPSTGRMFKVEVKTTYRIIRSSGNTSKLFGNYVCSWIMGEKNENIRDKDLFYCFVNISEDTKKFRFFIVPSVVVANYVKKQHQLWLDDDDKHARDNRMRMFRIGTKAEKYPFSTPCIEEYEDNWSFKR